MNRSRLLTAVLAVALALTACGGDEPEPAASPSPVPAPSPSPVPSPSPSPSPTGTAAPLTGELVDDDDVATRPALVVKIENTSKARPQAGLEQADIVIEQLVEGGVTRFFAVFQSEVPDEIGPVRSARLVDATLLPAFNGIFLYSGGRSDVEAAIGGTAVRVTEGDGGVYRESSRSAPSNLFAEGPGVYATAAGRNDGLTAPQPWFTFDEETPSGGTDGTSIDISMTSSATAGWTYDATAGGYLRSQGSTAQTTASGTPVVAANVVVLGVGTFQGGCCDTAGSPYVVTETVDTGRAIVLRDGEWFEATWSRPSQSAAVALSVGGTAFPLSPGPTWVHLTPNSRLPEEPAD